MSRSAVLAVAAVVCSSCGYRISGHADTLPKTLQTIAIPAFTNATSRYQLSAKLPAALTREFISRTRYRVVPDPNEADAILQGAVLTYNSYPTVFDPVTGRAAGVQVIVILKLKLVDRVSGNVLYQNETYEARARYEISVDQVAYFDESVAAMERLSVEVARMVVSSVLENF